MAKKNLLKRNLEARIVTRLEAIGKEVANKAFQDAESGKLEWKHWTNNLGAGYAYAVFYRGSIAYNTDREQAIGFTMGMDDPLTWHKGWAKHGIPDGTAPDWFDLWLKNYRPKSKSFELVVVNATYYGKILEEGKQRYGNGKKYKVLTYLLNDVVKLSKNFEGMNPQVSTL